ncbi:ParB/RepB/Spo0J family partition protein [Salmonella enterica subsp. enterica serovar Weltevreden]|uniref:ParB/RepB/Spo0J family partition protein n=1 Tax=Enterobacteriaceae TaxID=543 RepID=UPI000FC18514|nr:nuclease [Salmonella enterica subsp. enterica serovar Lexington]EAZ0617861.1 ParB/RepB/Spo0J family partition protein [Salmonella enterica]EBX8806393.1 ParB/RepB/Spo0J family partition protein [Salmonella enterica subsp. enterica serovar Weltevreden]ECM3796913.1 ParB/RepB/Spo0J family partition protein [Salmonella enterica subsp. enterica serovar Newport]EDW0192546.1 ParB/RepB/Spo0J family partition protein [Salmonella enterica subsp. enterica serovar Orion]EDW8090338.1 ParB/RepB/Spo0J fami
MVATNTTASKTNKSRRNKKSEPTTAPATDQTLSQLLAVLPVQQIAYTRLSASDLNVRLIKHTDKEVEELADSIAAVGILQNLVGVEQPDGTIGIVAGEGRRRALGVLVVRGSVDAEFPFVPVKVVPLDLAVAASMTENGKHKIMHPAEQIVGFRNLEREGRTPSQIGALLGYAPRHVQRCLKLANLAPSLLDALARDEITLEHCEALTLADSHERQEQVWKEAVEQHRTPSVHTLRKMATDDKMAISHPMFVFVGEEAYLAAGGHLTADLFSDKDSTFADAALVKSLLAGKLTVTAARIRQEQGWGWAEFRMTELSGHGEDKELYRFAMPAAVLTDDEQRRIDELENAIEDCSSYDDQYEFQQQIDDIRIEAKYREATPEFRAKHGVWVSWDNGNFQVQPGIRKLTDEDRAQEEQEREARQTQDNNVITYTTPETPADAYPATLVKAMSAERTLAVQAELAGRPDVSVALLTWTLCLGLFERSYGQRSEPLKASVTSNQYLLASLAPSGDEGKALLSLKAQREAFQATLPENWHLDFTWLLSWSAEQVCALLGFCAAHGINGIQERLYNRTERSELDGLEAALDFDLRKWWQPDATSYFGKLKISQIGKAYEEAGMAERAREVVKLKRRDAAAAAADELSVKGWLPDWMVRTQPVEQDETELTETDHTDHAA